MQKIIPFTSTILIGIAMIGLTTFPAKAMVTYSYTGNNYSLSLPFNDNSVVPGTYDTTMSVTGSFIVAAPLISNPFIPDISASVLSYSFNDGRRTLDDSNSNIDVFRMATNSDGAPIAWQISLLIPFPSSTFVGAQAVQIFTQSGEFDKGLITQCGGTVIGGPNCFPTFVDEARAPGDGVWTSPPISGPGPSTQVPEPSALLLFGVGLAGLMFLGRRRRQV